MSEGKKQNYMIRYVKKGLVYLPPSLWLNRPPDWEKVNPDLPQFLAWLVAIVATCQFT